MTTRPTQCVPGQTQDSGRPGVLVSLLTLTLIRVRRSKQLLIRCFWSPAPALVVPCSPMPVVTSVTQMAAYQVCSHQASECLLDHMLHCICPNVMSLRRQRRALDS